ncbi:MAG: pyridoxamine 5'-phosphate oxidase family protein [candidate division Zixibacteria bacterium]|nr:pyridoxamine 5'-phosphate oxidase family protein [candidate division Zixibacteria bacterium]NIR62753.1 pyridoxamine 5'-phosphate oxidase family protein [candidate division Zixibacteria bacterium]NIS17205.1 pyridoxamine 5'-phosphate oxidase family protein [candidate division Zixibacteria bacterium]NIS44823.1 pyridoxamine 5'-phosphate oxidase family protein [candidate division Zixibacteria bacterium]NIT53558.1 pyridoxamine 5'-phosphate oxidase family protein [candidate division Zixibacteria ba
MAEKVTELGWMKQLLAEEEVGHLAMSDNGEPYIVPINYAYLDGRIVLHCSMTGKKLDLIRKNPNVCFAVNRHPDKVKYHAEKRCHYRYHSVIAYGKAKFVESAQDRLTWIKRYRKYFNNRLDWQMLENDDIKSALRCGIILIDIEEMTGRREVGADGRAHEVLDKKKI